MSKLLPSNIGKEFKALLEAIKIDIAPEEIKNIYDKDLMPEDFRKFVAWQFNVLYEGVIGGDLSPEFIASAHALRKYEGTTFALNEVLKLIDGITHTITQTGPCLIRLDIIPDESFTKQMWEYLFYLIRDYKRATVHALVRMNTEVKDTVYIAAAVRTSRVIKMHSDIISFSPPEVTLVSPAANTVLFTDSEVILEWESLYVSSVEISYSFDSQNWIVISNNVSYSGNTGTFTWSPNDSGIGNEPISIWVRIRKNTAESIVSYQLKSTHNKIELLNNSVNAWISVKQNPIMEIEILGSNLFTHIVKAHKSTPEMELVENIVNAKIEGS